MMNRLIEKHQLTNGRGRGKILTINDGKSSERLRYKDWSKLSLVDLMKRRLNIAKQHISSGPNITNIGKAIYAVGGGYDPENPDLITGEAPTPGRATPLLSVELMKTINTFWKNLGKFKIRLGGNKNYASGILTKPGTASTTFNGLNINYITSPKGGKVTHKFYTDLGSEYILTKDGFARRIKSPHSNVGSTDSGLHNWNEGTTIFTKGEDGKLFNTAFYKLNDFGFKPGTYGLVRQDGKAKIMLIDPKTKLWREAMFSDVYPTSVKLGLLLDRVLSVDYSDTPFIGGHILEKGSGGWHPGSAVAFIEGFKKGGKMNTLEFLKKGGLIRKMQTAAGGPLVHSTESTRVLRPAIDAAQKINKRKLSNVNLWATTDDNENEINIYSDLKNDKYLLEFFEYDYAPRFLRLNKGVSQQYVDAAKNIYKTTPIYTFNENSGRGGYLISGEKIVGTNFITDLVKGKNTTPSIHLNTHYVLNKPTIAHELTHAFRQGYLGITGDNRFSSTKTPIYGGFNNKLGYTYSGSGYSNSEKDMLNTTYNMDGYKIKYDPLYEKGTTNTEVRYRIWKELYDKLGRRPTLGETDNYIKKYDWEKLLNMIKRSNAYGGAMYRNGMLPNKVRETLIKVAQNNNNNSYLLDDQTYYAKQGGMLNFLKKGSGIHIKPENKGKFTKYCKGKVTSECIAKGKRSSDPAVRKRATFADNARHFKHRSGGVIKVLEGGNILANIGTAAISTINNIKKQKEKNNSIDNLIEGLKKQSDADKKSRWKELYQLYINNYLSLDVPDGAHLSSIVAANQAYNNINVEDNPLYNEKIAKLESLKENIGNSIISGISSIGNSLISNISSKTPKTTTPETPKNVSPITSYKYDFGNNYSWSVDNGLLYNGIDSWKNSFKFNL